MSARSPARNICIQESPTGAGAIYLLAIHQFINSAFVASPFASDYVLSYTTRPLPMPDAKLLTAMYTYHVAGSLPDIMHAKIMMPYGFPSLVGWLP